MKRHQPVLRCLLALAAVAAVLPGVTLAEIFPFHLFHHRRCCAHPSHCSVCQHDHGAVADSCPASSEPDCEWVQETHVVQELAERPVERKRVVTVWRDVPETCWVKRPIVQNAYYTTTQMVPQVHVTPIHRVEIRPHTIMAPVATRQDVRPVRVWYPDCVPGKVKVDYGHYAYVPCCPPNACCGHQGRHHGHRPPLACGDNCCDQSACGQTPCNTGYQQPCCGDHHRGHHRQHHHGHEHAARAPEAVVAQQDGAAGPVAGGAVAHEQHAPGHHAQGHRHHYAHHHHKHGCCHQPACPQPCCPPPVCGNQQGGWLGLTGMWMGTGTGGGYGGGGGWNCGSGGGGSYPINPAVLTVPLAPVGCFQWGGPGGPWVRRVWISKICEVDAPVTCYKSFCVPVASEPVSTVKPVTNFRVIPVTDYASETTLHPETYTRSYPITHWQVVPVTKIRSVPEMREVSVKEMESYTVEREVKVWVKKPCEKKI